MARSKNQKPTTLNEAALAELFKAEHRPSHDQKWGTLEARDAPLARQAMIMAQALRESDCDIGDAYLRGVADAYAWHGRQHLITETRTAIKAAPKTKTTDPDA